MEIIVEVRNYSGNFIVIPFEIAKKLELTDGDYVELRNGRYVHYSIVKVGNNTENMVINPVIANRLRIKIRR